MQLYRLYYTFYDHSGTRIAISWLERVVLRTLNSLATVLIAEVGQTLVIVSLLLGKNNLCSTIPSTGSTVKYAKLGVLSSMSKSRVNEGNDIRGSLVLFSPAEI